VSFVLCALSLGLEHEQTEYKAQSTKLTCSFKVRMILLFSLLVTGPLVIAVFLYLHKHSSKSKSPMSSLATVHTTLSPDGSVLVNGELWLAKSIDDNLVPEKTKVIVVGLSDHLLLVSRQHRRKLEANRTTSI